MTTPDTFLVEARQSGNRLIGEVLYNREALDRPEMFAPAAFSSIADPLVLRLQHDRERDPVASTEDRTLSVTDTTTSLKLEASLRPGSAERELVARGALQGLSVEFVAKKESRDRRGVRIISDAHLAGIGLVDQGSYQSAVELRRGMRMGRSWFRARVPYERPMSCRCQGPECDSVMFEEGAFDLGDGDTLAVGGGGFSNVLGSLKRGTLITEDSAKGLEIGLTDATTSTAKRIISDAKVADMYARPILDLEASEFTTSGGLRTFTTAKVRAFLIKPTDTSRGHTPAKIERRRLWL